MSVDTNLTVVICVYNDWVPVDGCLQSLSEQADPPRYEVIVVDDGSGEHAPSFIQSWSDRIPLRILRETHSGISAVRNKGIQAAQSPIVLFVDADCRLQSNCLAELDKFIARYSQHNFFQLCIKGNSSTLVGRTEELRLRTLQCHLLKAEGRIRYLNTAGFAARRTVISSSKVLFEPTAPRAEDTLLLADLILSDDLPLFVPTAIVQHDVQMSALKCLRKDMRSAFLEERIYELIASRGIRVRVDNRERLEMLSSMWKTSRQPSIGYSAFLLLALRQTMRSIGAFGYRCTASPVNSRARNGIDTV
jgi:glycosyltransferase involved in cell wall biosynthesis